MERLVVGRNSASVSLVQFADGTIYSGYFPYQEFFKWSLGSSLKVHVDC